ncbi:MAG: hypothetical protein EXR58_05300 [Chloroflexi bacterium]|nr:hypothetical protein [Chloroflexota bacterium]
MGPTDLQLDGIEYRWDGRRWRWPEVGLIPKATIQELNRLRLRSVRVAEKQLTDPQAMLGLAINAKARGAQGRAEQFARRVLLVDPENSIAAAILSSILREKGRAKAALSIADRFQSSNQPPVLTSRGAALCDLGRWDEALHQIRQVLDIEQAAQGGGSEEALAVYGRIKANAPHLFTDGER